MYSTSSSYVSSDDGAQAVSAVEDAGFEPTLADANDDPGFDSARDASGCEVTEQDPSAGEFGNEGDEVIITVDGAQVDWENREGATRDARNLISGTSRRSTMAAKPCLTNRRPEACFAL